MSGSGYDAFYEEVIIPFQQWIDRGLTQDEINHAIEITHSLGYIRFDVRSNGHGFVDTLLYSAPSLWEAIVEWDQHYRGHERNDEGFCIDAVSQDGRSECIGYFTHNQPLVAPLEDEAVLVLQMWDVYRHHRGKYQQLALADSLPISPFINI